MKTTIATIALALTTVHANTWPTKLHPTNAPIRDADVPPSFDCSMRKLAYKFGKQLAPQQKEYESLWYALDLNNPNCTTPLSEEPEVTNPAVPLQTLPALDVHNAVLVSPGESIQEAVDFACTRTRTSAKKNNIHRPTVLLRAGTHYLRQQLVLGPEHSNLTLASYPGENAVVSGGKELNVAWSEYKPATTQGLNVWVADVSNQLAEQLKGLQLNGARATRARYPNIPGGIETSCGYGCMVESKNAEWTPPNFHKFGNVTYFTDSVPEHDRNDTAKNWFEHYMIGVNGLCSVYDPPVSYWCSEVRVFSFFESLP